MKCDNWKSTGPFTGDIKKAQKQTKMGKHKNWFSWTISSCNNVLRHFRWTPQCYDLIEERHSSTKCPLNSPKLSPAVWPTHSCWNKLTQMKRLKYCIRGAAAVTLVSSSRSRGWAFFYKAYVHKVSAALCSATRGHQMIRCESWSLSALIAVCYSTY